jgi:nitroreductase
MGLAGGQMMLQAAALGLGSCWVGGVDRKALGAVLRLPDHIKVVGLLTLGFPAEEPDPPARKPLAQMDFRSLLKD